MSNADSHELTSLKSGNLKGLRSEMQGDLPRDANSIQIMQAIDAMPKDWRALVHEYGFKAVCQAREDGVSLEDAADQLWMARSARQAQWLACDYITKRSFENV